MVPECSNRLMRLMFNNGEKTVSAKNIIIASGSRPRTIPGFEFDETTVLSSTGH
jgi:dihydrolipoamide dehydrogenase